MMALLLLRVFNEDSPVSEKILRIHYQATTTILPSSHPNVKYSMIYANNLIWQLLKDEDNELFKHFKIHLACDVDESKVCMQSMNIANVTCLKVMMIYPCRQCNGISPLEGYSGNLKKNYLLVYLS